ncbi:glycosyltransferase family 2 protein [Clostridium cellulovorans]|uniref:Glycosyl transferase family 2 n=1 Tax=Clostridium cellulovorans (strain ATCC 35296 / DSM 3052 / OCM 3 / 743B) TaxID=573061 RepID=D9SQ64_CLOC7|nr:glycosyltransferase family 2 protein [Clostridium cellulovorans]ADL50131.1 glycosyl transferase family 2 [Clostridium cellulovorans 743B]
MEIAVLIPCYNEEITIGKVVEDFKRELPQAKIYVYDNNSKDRTSEIAAAKGAIVVKETRQGKGNVVRSMFRDIEADVYIMVDGDDTYPAEFVHKLIKPVMDDEADMVIGDRLSNGTYKSENKRPFHNFGNKLVKSLIGWTFKNEINDIMTGYRAFNRFFVKTMPVLSSGFEIETEMSIHSLDKRFRLTEIPIDYRDRPEGSDSKLNTYRDGYRVIKVIFSLFKDYKPLAFFSILSILFLLLGIIIGTPVIVEFIESSYITKLPSAVLAVGLVIIAILSMACGLILDTISKNSKKQYELQLNDYKKEGIQL